MTHNQDHLLEGYVNSDSNRRPPSGNSTADMREADDREYFDSYGHLDIHRTMIDDYERTQAYREAILKNYPLFRGKTVLDVGCGTGILSVFCCQAGARRVFAVEASRAAAEHARAVVEENGYSDRVTVLPCRLEDAHLPGPVDVIVSEWMGHALLYESMLDAVLLARDRWLRPGGAMFPERAALRVALATTPAVDDGAAAFWRDVHARYRVHMASLARRAEQAEQRAARVAAVLPEEVHSHAATVCELDLRTLSAERAGGVRSGRLSLTSFGAATLTALALWFDVTFPGGRVLTTSPYAPATHWAQTLLPLPPRPLVQDWCATGRLDMRQNECHPRHWDITARLLLGTDEQSFHWVVDGTA